ncbi:MAG: hypothetical protein ACR2HG_07940 [Pyrinomonadaceae bacterium]
MVDSIKKFVQWQHERGTWQYDVFCLLIIAFIFLTPKAWFDKKERLATQTARLIVKAEDFSPDKKEMEKRVRELSGNANAKILDWHEEKNNNGEVFYEIDIR